MKNKAQVEGRSFKEIAEIQDRALRYRKSVEKQARIDVGALVASDQAMIQIVSQEIKQEKEAEEFQNQALEINMKTQEERLNSKHKQALEQQELAKRQHIQ